MVVTRKNPEISVHNYVSLVNPPWAGCWSAKNHRKSTLSRVKSPLYFLTDPKNEFTIVHNYARPSQIQVTKSRNTLPSELELAKVADIAKIDCFHHFWSSSMEVWAQCATLSEFRDLVTRPEVLIILYFDPKINLVPSDQKNRGLFWFYCRSRFSTFCRVPPPTDIWRFEIRISPHRKNERRVSTILF